MKGQQFFHSFELDDDAVFDQKIGPVPGLDTHALINDRQTNLMLELQTIYDELVVQPGAVSTFQQAGPKGGMNCDCAF